MSELCEAAAEAKVSVMDRSRRRIAASARGVGGAIASLARARVMIVLAAIVLVLGAFAYVISPHEGILRGVSIAGVPVGGLTPTAARATVASSLQAASHPSRSCSRAFAS